MLQDKDKGFRAKTRALGQVRVQITRNHAGIKASKCDKDGTLTQERRLEDKDKSSGSEWRPQGKRVLVIGGYKF